MVEQRDDRTSINFITLVECDDEGVEIRSIYYNFANNDAFAYLKAFLELNATKMLVTNPTVRINIGGVIQDPAGNFVELDEDIKE